MDKKKALLSIIPVLIFLSIQPAFGEVERGLDYEQELIDFDFATGKKTYRWVSVPERVLNDEQEYRDFIFTNHTNYLQVETGHGSIRLDKTTCAFDFYPKGRTTNQYPLFTDSIIARIAVNGTDNWQNISTVNNEVCQPSWDGTKLQAKKHKPGTGTLFYRYINTGTAWKTELEAINLSALTDRKFAFTQTIDLNRDTVKFGKTIINIDDYHNKTFNRQWIENNESKLLNLFNRVNLDFDLAFDNLWAISVYDTGTNKSKLSFDYARNSQILLPNASRLYDPTFGYDAAQSQQSVYTGPTTQCYGATGTTNGTAASTTYRVYVPATSASDNCMSQLGKWIITSIPDSATITSANFRYDRGAAGSSTNERMLVARNMTLDPQGSATPAQKWIEITQGNFIISPWTPPAANTNNHVVAFNSNGTTALQNALNQNWFGLGLTFVSMRSDSLQHIIENINGWELEVTYTTGPPPPNAPSDLTATATGKTQVLLDWSTPSLFGQTLIGYQINKTTPFGTPLTIVVNNTGSSITEYTVTGLTACTPYSFRIGTQSTSGYNASGNTANATTSCLDPPAAPTLSATAESDTAVRFTSVNGTTGDRNIAWYSFRCVKNQASSWTTIVSNSSVPNPRIYIYTSLTTADTVTCQWRDGSSAGFGPWSNNATGKPTLDIIEPLRSPGSDRLVRFAEWFDGFGGVYMGMSLFPFLVMLIGMLARPRTTHIFVIIVLSLMGILHGSGYYQYPEWFWALSILFGLVIVLSRRL
jgi:hypothetical protein